MPAAELLAFNWVEERGAPYVIASGLPQVMVGLINPAGINTREEPLTESWNPGIAVSSVALFVTAEAVASV